MSTLRLALLAILMGSSVHAQTPDVRITQLVAGDAFKNATAFLERDYDRFVNELITLTEIPAPPFKEQKRAAAFMEMLRGVGLSDVEMDTEGNVMGIRKGTVGTSMLAVVAHLDTVFPDGTDVRVRRQGTKLFAPGVGDNSRALALLLTLVRAMNAARIPTDADILFVGNVGEEGDGDLRGVKHLLQSGKYTGRIQRFVAIDGLDQSELTNGALGSKRYRVTFTGPGGHSFRAFGVVSPAFAMGNAMTRLGRTHVSTKPKTTFNVGVVAGGTSVNAVPTETSMDVDLRSESRDELSRLVEVFEDVVQAAVDEENQIRSTAEGRIVADIKLIGDRPAGESAVDSPLVTTTAAALKAFGLTPRYSSGSTDANIPISLGIPAVTIGRGTSGRNHSLDEWTDVEMKSAIQAAQVALAVVLGAVDLP
jgi:tripeptide aminopeptidase